MKPIRMRLSEWNPPKYAMVGGNVYVDEGRSIRPETRLEHWLRVMGYFSRCGDWILVDKNPNAACIGTVCASLTGPLGRVEVWNNGEVHFISKRVGGNWTCDNCSLVDWTLERAISEACAMAGLQEVLLL